MTAPVGDVIIAIRPGYRGTARLRSAAVSPSSMSRVSNRRNSSSMLPAPRGNEIGRDELRLTRAPEMRNAARRDDEHSVSGGEADAPGVSAKQYDMDHIRVVAKSEIDIARTYES